MNRAQRRAKATTAAAKRALPKCVNAEPSTPSDEVCHGICRSCSKERQLFLPARICGRCIEKAMALAMTMTREQADAMLAALDEEEADV